MDASWLDWAAVAVLGGLVGTSELISRYKDDPWAAIKTLPAIFYVVINCAGSLAALGLIHEGCAGADSRASSGLKMPVGRKS